MLRLHVMSAQLTDSKDGLSVRLAEIEQKWAQLNDRINAEPKLRRRLGPIMKKLLHDVGHHKRATKVALHKSEKAVADIARTPIDVAAMERTLERSLEVSARINKELTELNRSLDELLAACGLLS